MVFQRMTRPSGALKNATALNRVYLLPKGNVELLATGTTGSKDWSILNVTEIMPVHSPFFICPPHVSHVFHLDCFPDGHVKFVTLLNMYVIFQVSLTAPLVKVRRFSCYLSLHIGNKQKLMWPTLRPKNRVQIFLENCMKQQCILCL